MFIKLMLSAHIYIFFNNIYLFSPYLNLIDGKLLNRMKPRTASQATRPAGPQAVNEKSTAIKQDELAAGGQSGCHCIRRAVLK